MNQLGEAHFIVKMLLRKLLPRATHSSTAEDGPVVVVSGLPRSGTSLMMRMLEAGGMALLTDGIRRADADNPRGYCEFERVKQLRHGDQAWIVGAQNKAVKVISELLRYLPDGYEYRVIFMRRNIDEVLASQREMLARARRGVSTQEEEEKLADLFRRHLAQVQEWLVRQPNKSVLFVDYRELVTDGQSQIPRVNEFLGGKLDVVRMANVIDPALYRQRA